MLPFGAVFSRVISKFNCLKLNNDFIRSQQTYVLKNRVEKGRIFYRYCLKNLKTTISAVIKMFVLQTCGSSRSCGCQN